MSLPLITAENDFALWAVMFLLTGLTLVFEKLKWGRKVSGPILIIVMAALLSNLGLIPKSAPVYDSVWTYGVPVAVVLLLFNANLKKIFTESGPTLLAFTIGAVGTTAGVIVGVWLLPLGVKTPELAAVFSATYIGGSLNFAAVSEAVSFTDKTLITASLAADNVVGTLFLAVLIALPSVKPIAKFFGYSADDPSANADIAISDEKTPSAPELTVLGVVTVLGIGFIIVAASTMLAETLGRPEIKLLIATVITVALSTLAPTQMQRATAAFPIGMVILYMFFGLIGAGVDIVAMLSSGLTIAAFAAIILAVHLLVLLPVSRLFRLSLPEVLIGSNACIMGPPTAAAMAGANGWNHLITPAILCGTLGYTLANFIGLSLFAWLS